MILRFQPFLYALKHPFRLATGMRTHTTAMLVEVSAEGLTGYGEAAMPPYYGENHDTAAAYLTLAQSVLKRYPSPEPLENILSALDALAPGNNAAKAAVDLALHDLWGKMKGKPLYELLETPVAKMPLSSFTLGIDTPEILQEKLKEAEDFRVIKVKLGSADDRLIINTIRALSDKPIYADANQGWTQREEALELCYWLQEQGVQLIEQPFPKDQLGDAAWLSARSPLPVFADESFQRLSDLERVSSAYHGVNVKLMKCTGLHEGLKCVREALKLKLKLMVGCMTESPCGIRAAALLAPHCDFADLDGCWLIQNSPWEMPLLEEGKIVLGDGAGLGLR